MIQVFKTKINKSIYRYLNYFKLIYTFIISIIARKQFGSMTKLKVIPLAERLSGPILGIYCYDLFPFTNYEFYVFCVNCVLNFILLMGLLKWLAHNQ